MQLRDYQQRAIDDLRQALGTGKRRPVVQSPTGSGKTIIAAAIINMARAKGKRVIFAVPALSLIDQTVERFRQNGIFEIGVMQGQHEMTDYEQPVQVCSVQTLARREIPAADLVIIDECHLCFKLFDDWMNRPEWKKIPFIGLTATPWAKGMGASGRWDHLIIGSTLQELIELGHLSGFRVFAPAHPDLTGVKTVAGDYDLKGLGHAMDKKALVADIVTTWLERGENRPTVCFAVNRIHAKHLQDQFISSGVVAEYMDAYTSMADRNEIVRRFEQGEVKVICNVGVLTTGFDADVRCIILARPTKSEILYVQMIGRGLRTANDKANCLVLDHSDTTLRLGFVTDIGTSKLHDGTANRQVTEKTAPLPKECPSCAFLKPPKLRKCPSCGIEPVAKPDVENEDGELYELTPGKKVKIDTFSMYQKQAWYRELILHARLRGYKPGWAYWAYKDKFKVNPDHSLDDTPADFVSYEVQNWITSRNIRKARAREKVA